MEELEQIKPEYCQETLIVKFKSSAFVSKARARKKFDNHGAKEEREIPHLRYKKVRVPVGQLEGIKAKLEADPDVESVEYNHKYSINTFLPNDPLYPTQYEIKMIKADKAWDFCQGDPNVIIGVMDTGFRVTHEDLVNKFILPGWNTVLNNTMISSTDTHGTATSSSAAASVNNGKGCCGVAPLNKILPVKITDEATPDSSWSYDQAEAFVWYADNPHNVKVINISFGGPGYVQSYQDAINYAWSKDIVIVAASGNENVSTEISAKYPASYNNVLSVAAVDNKKIKSSFSNYGNLVDICAPGTSVTTAGNGSDTQYLTISGTSFASPITAGAAALVRSANPALTNQQVVDILKNTVQPHNEKDDYIGTGLLDVAAAVNMAYQSAATKPDYFQFYLECARSGLHAFGNVAVDIMAYSSRPVTTKLYANNVLIYTSTKGPEIYYLDTTKLSEGPNTIRVTADNGLEVKESSFSFNVYNIQMDIQDGEVTLGTKDISVWMEGEGWDSEYDTGEMFLNNVSLESNGYVQYPTFPSTYTVDFSQLNTDIYSFRYDFRYVSSEPKYPEYSISRSITTLSDNLVISDPFSSVGGSLWYDNSYSLVIGCGEPLTRARILTSNNDAIFETITDKPGIKKEYPFNISASTWQYGLGTTTCKIIAETASYTKERNVSLTILASKIRNISNGQVLPKTLYSFTVDNYHGPSEFENQNYVLVTIISDSGITDNIQITGKTNSQFPLSQQVDLSRHSGNTTIKVCYYAAEWWTWWDEAENEHTDLRFVPQAETVYITTVQEGPVIPTQSLSGKASIKAPIRVSLNGKAGINKGSGSGDVPVTLQAWRQGKSSIISNTTTPQWRTGKSQIKKAISALRDGKANIYIASQTNYYNIYKDGKIVATNVAASNISITNETASSSGVWTVKKIVNGVESQASAPLTVQL